MVGGGGLTLQIFEVPSKIVLDQFLLEAKIRVVGVLDTSLNNEDYDYVTVIDAVATPWPQTNPIKPIGYPEGFLKISDMVMVYPLDPNVQQKIQLMPHAQRGVFYTGSFIIQGNLSMGADMSLSEAMESLPKRFLAATEVSLFPMFPARTALPDWMPVVLLNRSKIYQYHGIQG